MAVPVVTSDAMYYGTTTAKAEQLELGNSAAPRLAVFPIDLNFGNCCSLQVPPRSPLPLAPFDACISNVASLYCRR